MKLPAMLARRGEENAGAGRSALRSERAAELVPQARLSGPMPWVIAIMVAMTAIAAAGALSLRNAGAAAQAELAGGVTIQIVEADPAARARQAEAAAALLQDTSGVVAVRLVPQSEIDALIAPWLGQGAEPGKAGSGDEGVPVPALIEARLAGQLTAARVAALGQRLAAVAPAARVDAQAGWLRPVFAAIGSLQLLALALIALLGFATAAAVLLAARTALGTNRDTIEIVHLLGGTDAQIARIFQRSITFDAAGGGAVGLGLATVTIIVLGQNFAGRGSGLVDGGSLDWLDWLAIALVPLAVIALAALTARLTVLRALRTML